MKREMGFWEGMSKLIGVMVGLAIVLAPLVLFGAFLARCLWEIADWSWNLLP